MRFGFACFFSLASMVSASSFDNISIVANPNDQQVVQGGDGSVTFKVFGPLGISVVLDTLDPFYVYGGKIDPEDEITKIARTGGTCGIGSIVSALTSCTYTLGFVTDDPRRPLDPDKDYGLWNIDLDVTAHGLLDPTTTYMGNGVAEVDVLDPGFVPTPEPGSVVMVAAALACWIACKFLARNGYRHLLNIYKH